MTGDAQDAFGDAVARTGLASLRAMQAMEAVARRLHPPEIEGLREQVATLCEPLEEAREALGDAASPPGLEPFHRQLSEAAERAEAAVRMFADADDPMRAVARVLGAMRLHCRTQESLYPLRQALKPLGAYFAEPAWHDRLAELDPEAPEGVSVGLHAAGPSDDADARGGFHLYVPERYDGSTALPLVVALHGGTGHGRDFVWTWLREARSRNFLLLSPTSRGDTWSLMGPDVDAAALRSMIDYVAEHWRVDRERILLTGLSDGGTYSLLAGHHPDAPYTALACVSGVLHPRIAAEGNLEQAGERRIYLAHGALDWMFPVDVARAGRDTLAQAGADVTYREIEDLSHAYPREENDRILRWFDPTLVPEG